MNEPIIFVAFGITGDLMRKKILPALFSLYAKSGGPKHFRLVGISRKDWSQETFQSYIAQTLGDDSAAFAAQCIFVQGDAGDAELAEKLQSAIAPIKEQLGASTQLLFYISTSPALYANIFAHLGVFAGDSTKILIEKPFGLSLQSAHELNALLHKNFTENQIYRVDHYLGKQSVRDLAQRAGAEAITQVSIRLFERAKIDGRGDSYDAVGALRDVGQNHLLECTAMLFSAKAGRAEILERLHILSPEEVAAHATHTQYAGYNDTPGVRADSNTETYFKIETVYVFDGMRIPLVLEAGKDMPEDSKEMIVTYANGETRRFPLDEKASGESEYAVLLSAALSGDHTLFVGERELDALWKFIDPIIAQWHK